MTTKKKNNIISVNLTPKFPNHYVQGISKGIQYTILDDDNQILVTPFYCKDYLQDIFWSENVKKPIQIWGLNWKPGQLNIDRKSFRFAIIADEDNMKEKVSFLQELINYFDDAQEIEKTKVLETDNDKIIVVEFSKDWTTCGPMLSALTTLIRCSGEYEGGDPMAYFNKIKGNWTPKVKWILTEVKRFDSSLPKLKKLLGGVKSKQTWPSNVNSPNHVHDNGIVEGVFP